MRTTYRARTREAERFNHDACVFKRARARVYVGVLVIYASVVCFSRIMLSREINHSAINPRDSLIIAPAAPLSVGL